MANSTFKLGLRIELECSGCKSNDNTAHSYCKLVEF